MERTLVFQGEDASTTNNKFLGEFTLKDLPAKPKGKMKVDVTLSMDANGIHGLGAAHRQRVKGRPLSEYFF